MTIEPGSMAYAVEVDRIEKAIEWKGPLSDSEKTFYQTHLLTAWENSKVALERAKVAEMNLRKQIVAFSFDPNKKSGTERIELANGYELKAVKKLNYGFIKNSDGKRVNKLAIDAALTAIEKIDPVGALIAERLVKWDPTLSLTEYNQLSPQMKAEIDKVIVVTDGAPSLEIVPPKGTKG